MGELSWIAGFHRAPKERLMALNMRLDPAA
jgi:hypothetical protein